VAGYGAKSALDALPVTFFKSAHEGAVMLASAEATASPVPSSARVAFPMAVLNKSPLPAVVRRPNETDVRAAANGKVEQPAAQSPTSAIAASEPATELSATTGGNEPAADRQAAAISETQSPQPEQQEMLTGLFNQFLTSFAASRQEPSVCTFGNCMPAGQRLGTTIDWVADIQEASRQAEEEEKLVYLLQVSGNFAREEFT
jgi:hypothetical protein